MTLYTWSQSLYQGEGRLIIKIHPTAEVSPKASIGLGSMIWHFAQVREESIVGPNCVIGRGAYIGKGVILGEACKIQNYALLYEPARISDGVFIGPGAVLTNDTYPRAITIDGTPKSSEDWTATGVTVEMGASIGANSTCVAPVTIGQWAVIAAGSVVTKDVPPFALVAGVPARQIGWVGKAGRRLMANGGVLTCPLSGERYQEIDGRLREVSCDD